MYKSIYGVVKTTIVIAALIAVASITANAKAVAYVEMRNPGDRIVLHDQQRNCPDGFLFAAITWQGRPLNACWKLVQTPGGPGVHIVDEDGDTGLLPTSVFQEVKDI